MICPVCEKEKGEDLMQIHPIYDDYMCYECLPDDIRVKFDESITKQTTDQN